MTDPIPPEHILEATTRALARIEPAEPGAFSGLLQRVFDAVGDVLADLFGGIAGVGSSVPWWIPVGLIVALIAFLLFRVLRELFHARQAEARLAALDAAGDLRGPATAAAHEDTARRLAAEGRFVDALRHLHAATFARLHEAAGRAWDPSLTPREHLRHFRRRDFFADLRRFVNGYQQASFGGRAVDDDTYRRLEALRPSEARP